MSPPITLEQEAALWKDIHRVAVSLSKKIREASPATTTFQQATTLPSDFTPPPLDLPFPSALLSPVLLLDIPHNTRHNLYQCFTKCIQQRQKAFKTIYERACMAIPRTADFDFNVRALHSAYESMYKRQCFPLIESQVSVLLKEVSQRRPGCQAEKKKAFNTVCLLFTME